MAGFSGANLPRLGGPAVAAGAGAEGKHGMAMDPLMMQAMLSGMTGAPSGPAGMSERCGNSMCGAVFVLAVCLAMEGT